MDGLLGIIMEPLNYLSMSPLDHRHFGRIMVPVLELSFPFLLLNGQIDTRGAWNAF